MFSVSQMITYNIGSNELTAPLKERLATDRDGMSNIFSLCTTGIDQIMEQIVIREKLQEQLKEKYNNLSFNSVSSPVSRGISSIIQTLLLDTSSGNTTTTKFSKKETKLNGRVVPVYGTGTTGGVSKVTFLANYSSGETQFHLSHVNVLSSLFGE